MEFKIGNQARSFVAIMIIIALSALFLRFSTKKLIEITIAQNESNAQTTLKFISVALENYAKDHIGAYPSDLSFLTTGNPAYLDKDYIRQSFFKGYDYNCPRLDGSGYSCSATPISCNLTGRMVYTVTTGGLIVADDCSKKE